MFGERRVLIPLLSSPYSTLNTPSIHFNSLLKNNDDVSNLLTPILDQMSSVREHFRSIVPANNNNDDVTSVELEKAVMSYLSHLYGLVYKINDSSSSSSSSSSSIQDGNALGIAPTSSSLDPNVAMEGEPEQPQQQECHENDNKYSKLRHIITYVWNIKHKSRMEESKINDSVWEVICIVLTLAMSLKREAQRQLNKNNGYDLKSSFKLLLRVCGILEFLDALSKDLDPSALPLVSSFELTMTGDHSAINFLKLVTQAEAQEVALHVSLDKLDEKPLLVAQVAKNTVEKYETAFNSLPPAQQIAFWHSYTWYKKLYYTSLSHIFAAIYYNKVDENGVALASIAKAQLAFIDLESKLKSLLNMSEFRSSFLKECVESQMSYLKDSLSRFKEKFERENSMVYHQTIPDEIPADKILSGQSVGQVPVFSYPEPSPIWTENSYNSINIGVVVPHNVSNQLQRDVITEQIEIHSIGGSDNSSSQATSPSQNVPKRHSNKKQNDGFSLCSIL